MAMNTFAIVYQAFSCVSLIFSGTVVVTGCTFPAIMLSEHRSFSQIIFCISLSDFLGSIGNAMGYPNNGTEACTIQAFLFLMFLRASWLWTVALVYQLSCMLTIGRLWLNRIYLHIICWGIPLVLVFLPFLTSNGFGISSSTQGFAPCSFAGDDHSPSAAIWYTLSFFGLLLICFVALIGWTSSIYFHFRKSGFHMTHRAFTIYHATKLYPVAICITWFPDLVYAILLVTSSIPNTWTSLVVGQTLEILSTQYGTLTAIVYFSTCKEARCNWYVVYHQLLAQVRGYTSALSPVASQNSSADEGEDTFIFEEEFDLGCSSRDYASRTVSNASGHNSTTHALDVQHGNSLRTSLIARESMVEINNRIHSQDC